MMIDINAYIIRKAKGLTSIEKNEDNYIISMGAFDPNTGDIIQQEKSQVITLGECDQYRAWLETSIYNAQQQLASLAELKADCEVLEDKNAGA